MDASSRDRLRIGVRFEPDWKPEDLPDFARWAENAGYDELWFSEDLPWAGGMVMATAALMSTERIRVGIGLIPAITRNVGTTAMEIAALERLAPGRLTIAIGHGVPVWMEQIGASTPSRMAALEETVVALRGLLAGEKVSADGKQVKLDALELGFPPAHPTPILIGTTGPKGLRMAGRVSDGVNLPELSSPAALTWAREQMSTDGEPGELVQFALLSVDEDRETALAQTRERAQRIVDFQVFSKLTEIAGLGADGSEPLTDEILQSVAATGTPDDIAATIGAWADAGTSVVVLVAGADDPKASYAKFAEDVLPKVRGAIG
jgi:alkanesulfonate monooxygenase SsuD/methylene tetrahydromethanopterin reductase-like flavin-dependent oxidoreductase (luciferase family)